MRILQVGKFYPIRGGVEKVMYDLMEGLSSKGIACDMLCASTEDYPAGIYPLNPHANLIVVATKIKAAATMLAPDMIGKLRKIAKDYDIIHIHHPDPMATLALFLSGYKGKVVLHWHSDILKQKTLLKLYKPLQDWLIKRADIIVGTTPIYVAQSKFLQKFQHKVDYIPIGINPISADKLAIESLRNKYKDKTIVFSLGRLVEYKGYEYLIKAMEFLDDSYHLIIGGTGPLHSELKELIANKNLGHKVELLGFVQDEDVPTYFAACDIFCLSSILKTEAFAIVQIEAMSCGKPVVSTNIPESGVAWVNKNNVSGLVVDIENGAEIAQAVQAIMLNRETYDRFSEGSYQRFQDNFTLEKMVDKSLQIYNKILGI
ncbi:glycosyltransferase [Sphingobacterium lactis]|uniref:glycosyltransferase n=1 Tax=Sphingobacterium lactis TaxID=797291 RepID=UPI003EC799AC